MKKIKEGKYSVGQNSFNELQDAVAAAVADSLIHVRADICTRLTKGIYGYAGTAVVVAHFVNGLDIRTMATDEDGIPDYGVRAQALTAR